MKERQNRVEKMWVRDGAAYFFGPIFIHPEETEHEPTKMFYKKEVPEEDVLLCESRYIETEKQMKKFKGLKRFSLSGKVVEDELIVPQKEPSPLLDKKIEELEAKFADMTDEELEDLGEDDGDLADRSLPPLQPLASDMDIKPCQNGGFPLPPQSAHSTPKSIKGLSKKTGSMSGYILFS
ncbi:hypothetical protein CRUP_021531, partial [Coryphaenoides rupestris]